MSAREKERERRRRRRRRRVVKKIATKFVGPHKLTET
jgi:hypothetical protein